MTTNPIDWTTDRADPVYSDGAHRMVDCEPGTTLDDAARELRERHPDAEPVSKQGTTLFYVRRSKR